MKLLSKINFQSTNCRPQKVRHWVRRPQGPALATPLFLRLVGLHQLPLRELVLFRITCGLI